MPGCGGDSKQAALSESMKYYGKQHKVTKFEINLLNRALRDSLSFLFMSFSISFGFIPTPQGSTYSLSPSTRPPPTNNLTITSNNNTYFRLIFSSFNKTLRNYFLALIILIAFFISILNPCYSFASFPDKLVTTRYLYLQNTNCLMTNSYEHMTYSLRSLSDLIRLSGKRVKHNISFIEESISEFEDGNFSNLAKFRSELAKVLSDLENLKHYSQKSEYETSIDISNLISLCNEQNLYSYFEKKSLNSVKTELEKIISCVNSELSDPIKNERRLKKNKAPKKTSFKRIFSPKKRLANNQKELGSELSDLQEKEERLRLILSNNLHELIKRDGRPDEDISHDIARTILELVDTLRSEFELLFSVFLSAEILEYQIISDLRKLDKTQNKELQEVISDFKTKFYSIIKRDLSSVIALEDYDSSMFKKLSAIIQRWKSLSLEKKVRDNSNGAPVYPRKDMSRRDFLIKAGKGAAVVGGAVAVSGIDAILPKEAKADSPRPQYVTLTNEHNFKEIISRYESAWVMYTFGGKKASDKRLGKQFWQILQNEFGSQVESYIIVDTTGWHRNIGGIAVEREIGKNKFPSFILYNKDKIVKLDTGDPLRVRGPPENQKKTNFVINYIKKHSYLR